MMTAAAATPLDDDDFDYGFGDPEIDHAVRYWAAQLPPPSAAQKATVSAIFNRAIDRSVSDPP